VARETTAPLANRFMLLLSLASVGGWIMWERSWATQ
jgi:hypothetical protein